MNQIVITNSFEETSKFGTAFIKKLLASKVADPVRSETLRGERSDKALVVTLFGELGSGKTTFVQGLAKGLGIERRIISPTFVIVRQYNLRNYSSSEATRSREVQDGNSSRLTLFARTINFYHIDLYRTESKKDIDGLGISEIINDVKNIVVIEWAEKMKNLLPQERIDIHFEYMGTNKRKIIINNLSLVV